MRGLNRQSRLLTENPVYSQQYRLPDKMTIIIDSSKQIPFQLNNKKYMIRGEIILLDIVQSNIAERPVYFLEGRGTGFEDHLELQGCTFKLAANTKVIDDNFLYGGIDPRKTWKKLMEDFRFHPDPKMNNSAGKVVLTGYLYAFSYLARHFADNEQSDSCRMVIERYLQLFPNSVYKMDYLTLPMLSAAYDADLKEQGNSITYIILGNLDEKIQSGLSDFDRRVAEYTLKNLEYLVRDDDQIKSDLESLQIELNNH
jgi:hypothetical protein